MEGVVEEEEEHLALVLGAWVGVEVVVEAKVVGLVTQAVHYYAQEPEVEEDIA